MESNPEPHNHHLKHVTNSVVRLNSNPKCNIVNFHMQYRQFFINLDIREISYGSRCQVYKKANRCAFK